MQNKASVSNKYMKLIKFIKKYGWCYMFIAVPVLLFLSFTIYPLISAFLMSFQKYNVMNSKWIGLENYKYIFHRRLFGRALYNTLIYTVGTVPINVLISLGLALMLFPLGRKIQTFFKACFYLPAVASGVTISLVWYVIYDPTPDGLLNKFLALFGIPNINWLGKENIALFSLMLMTYLGGHGSGVILYLASLGSIPSTFYEAADIDGANGWAKFINITWPLLKPTTLYMLVVSTIGAAQSFMQAYLLTSGGPNHATTTIGYLIYQDAFEYFDFGLAAAESFVLALLIAGLSIIQFKYMSSDVEY